MTPTNQQNEALAHIKNWYKTYPKPQVFYLGGFAGTGKTTLAKTISEEIRGEVIFAAFTGKAALVLSSKGCPASTIHSLIYIPIVNKKTGVVTYSLNDNSVIRNASLLIVDECSMVDVELGEDLLSFDIPILVIGDPAQLPPVKGEGIFTSGKPDFMLTEIHRQALDNPIIQMSMKIRDKQRLSAGSYGDSLVIPGAKFDYSSIMNTEQLIAGRNITRKSFNSKMREVIGFDSDFPEVGDRLICQKNDHSNGMLNGSMWSVSSIQEVLPRSIELSVDPLEYGFENTRAVQLHETNFKTVNYELNWKEKGKYTDMDFGYCITAHKSQGSQWNDIIVFDESWCFREESHRWLYTAVTRAAERITVVT